jgi:hypothetical protein
MPSARLGSSGKNSVLGRLLGHPLPAWGPSRDTIQPDDIAIVMTQRSSAHETGSVEPHSAEDDHSAVSLGLAVPVESRLPHLEPHGRHMADCF